MRFLMLYRAGSGVGEGDRRAVDGLIEEMQRAGVLLATDGLRPVSEGTRVRIRAGEFEVTDGPIACEREIPAGYAIVQVSTAERAVELAKRFLAVMDDGSSEIRLLPA